mmetsp:Transcript_98921/g.121102  ORF Transcript_98921/g.121102 Transcript_98921/m.121102 type:complete len:493 (-) Transcript_98921:123-1601(-)
MANEDEGLLEQANANYGSTTNKSNKQIHVLSPSMQSVTSFAQLQRIMFNKSSSNFNMNKIIYPNQSPHHGEAHVMGGSSPILSVVWNQVNSIVGAGIVGLPYVFKQSGILGGIILIVIFSYLTVYTLKLLIMSAKLSKTTNYEDLCEYCFGKYGYYSVSLAMFIYDAGALLSYLIIMGDSMQYIITNFGLSTQEDRKLAIIIVSTVGILPGCLYRDISKIERLSAISVFSVSLMTGCVIYEWFNIRFITNIYDSNFPDIWPLINLYGIPEALGIVAFAFVCHDNSFLIYKTLKNNTIKRYTILAFLGMLIQCILCVVICIYGYLSFGDNVEDDLLLNFDIENRAIIAIRILYTFRMSFCFPTAFYVVRHILYSIVYRDGDTYEHASKLKRIIFTLIPLLSFLIIGLFLQDLGFVMSLAGLLSALNLAFVLPSLCHIKKGTPYPLKFWKAKDGKKWDAFIDIVPPLILIVFGTFAATVGSIELILTTLLGRDV